MKVSELIAELQKMPQDAEVILQKDSEGNGYTPLLGADDECIYVPDDNTWSGIVYDTKWTSEDADMDSDEWQKILAKPRCVVLFPVN